MNYTNKLKSLRVEKGLTQKDMADSLGVERITYNHYENQEKIVPINRLNDVSNFFSVSIDYIFGFTNISNYENTRYELDVELSKSRLKKIRKENKHTLEQLGRILKCSYGTIAGYESGRYLIATAFLYDICKTYNVSADYLLGKIDEMRPASLNIKS